MPDLTKCQRCDVSATVHISQVNQGQQSTQHLCEQHARDSGVLPQPLPAPGQHLVNGVLCNSAMEGVMQGLLSNFRGTIRFAKKHGHMPASVEDLREGMAIDHDEPETSIADPKVAGGIAWMEKMVAFVEKNGRPPQTPQECAEVGTAPET